MARMAFVLPIRLLQTIDMPGLFPMAAIYVGTAYSMSGRHAEAISLLEEALQHGSMASTQTRLQIGLSAAYLRAGRPQDAVARAQQALDLSLTQKQRGHQAWSLHLLGDIAMHGDPPDIKEAETHYQQALALANELGMHPLQAHCHRGLGMLYSQIGQSEQARAELSTAINIYREMDMTFWLPETEAALAEVEQR